jgi:hypothetical protein
MNQHLQIKIKEIVIKQIIHQNNYHYAYNFLNV